MHKKLEHERPLSDQEVAWRQRSTLYRYEVEHASVVDLLTIYDFDILSARGAEALHGIRSSVRGFLGSRTLALLSQQTKTSMTTATLTTSPAATPRLLFHRSDVK